MSSPAYALPSLGAGELPGAVAPALVDLVRPVVAVRGPVAVPGQVHALALVPAGELRAPDGTGGTTGRPGGAAAGVVAGELVLAAGAVPDAVAPVAHVHARVVQATELARPASGKKKTPGNRGVQELRNFCL